MTAAYPIARQVAYFRPSDNRGKYHAAWLITWTPVCGARVELASDAIRTTAGEDSATVHPIVCRRCLRLSAPAGVSAEGIAR